MILWILLGMYVNFRGTDAIGVEWSSDIILKYKIVISYYNIKLFMCILLELMVRVYADIVGDLFHCGHINFFKQCLKLGDDLIIGVCDDDIVSSYKRKPILNLQERVQIIQAIKYVSQTIVNPPSPITRDFIQTNNIDIVVHGNDMTKDELYYWYKDAIDMDIFKSVSYTSSISTTDIINRIQNRIQKVDSESLHFSC